ncbi:MAG: NAD+ synthase [Porticoccaceae bacterium]|nr:MAG: NAD+ synthase [Porticoccaceae bacterium]
MAELTLLLAQLNPLVGDIPGNTERVVTTLAEARRQGAQLVVFPELVLTGYPPEDLLLRPSLEGRVSTALAELAPHTQGLAAVVGYPRHRDGVLYNMAGFFHDGRLVAEYAKQHLPNYQVFDEKRYFGQGTEPCVVELAGFRLALTVCEDVWHPGPVFQARQAGAEVVVNINASPFHRHKHQERIRTLTERVTEGAMPIVYLNMVGGQDELVFDGGSLVMDADERVAAQAPFFREGLFRVRLAKRGGRVEVVEGPAEAPPSTVSAVYQAIVLGLSDYVAKNRFPGVVLGLSGGIDSALTLALAVDALGAERVEAVMMPFRYTSALSRRLAAEEAARLGVRFREISIEPIYDAVVAQLAEEFAGLAPDQTEENIQARARGLVLMAISNKKGLLVLATGNKSELATGYCTLYGDMVGGFAPLKDVPKTLVYELARHRNARSPAIPEEVIGRPPTAELRPGQKDEDSLPPYPILDKILELYIEEDRSAEAIVAAGFSPADVYRVIRMVDANEYKRRQAPVGVRVTRRGFGRDRRYPITNGWQPGS